MKEMLYEKVKFVEGENFVTVEDTDALTDAELQSLSSYLIRDPDFSGLKNRTLLVPSTFKKETVEVIQSFGFSHHDEVYFFKCDLEKWDWEGERSFTIQPFSEVGEEVFRETWRRSMEGSLNAPQSLNMDEQMRSVKKELGAGYVNTCLTAYEGDRPMGVIMPHIEPGTMDEGRFFYFGLVPEERGKNKSTPLYQEGLDLLKKRFKASYSVGATSIHNQPMLNVFNRCGCKETGRVGVYKFSS